MLLDIYVCVFLHFFFLNMQYISELCAYIGTQLSWCDWAKHLKQSRAAVRAVSDLLICAAKESKRHLVEDLSLFVWMILLCMYLFVYYFIFYI